MSGEERERRVGRREGEGEGEYEDSGEGRGLGGDFGGGVALSMIVMVRKVCDVYGSLNVVLLFSLRRCFAILFQFHSKFCPFV